MSILLEAMPVRSVVDVGCGVGTWLAAFMERGVVDADGYDGPYVDQATLLIPPARFRAADLTHPLQLARRYDLAVCLEVGEHLPEHSASVLVRSLVEASDVVLFSAAVPGQGGTHHVNEQWPAYWDSLFRSHGYIVRDWLRPAVWTEPDIDWWYAQNMLVFARREALHRYPGIDRDATTLGSPVALVHPRAFAAVKMQAPGVRESVRILARSMRRAMRRRFGIGPTGW